MKLQLKSGREGLTLIEVLAVIFVLALLTALFLPAATHSRIRSSRVNCANNLKQIGLAFKLWAGDNNDKFPMQVPVTDGGTMELIESGQVWVHFEVMSNELSSPRLLVCPGDTNRQPGLSFSQGLGNQNVSYFVGVDATPDAPAMLIAGDDNLGVSGVAARQGMLTLWSHGPVAWIKPRLDHGKGGNICLADAGVQQVGDAELRGLLQRSGVATNRLAMP